MKNLRLFMCTWNVGSSEPLGIEDLSRLFPINSLQLLDLYAICLQEIETGIIETARSFVAYDDWTKQFMKYFSSYSYFLVANVRVQGVTLCVFAHLAHLPFIRFIKTDIERTGRLGSTWGNKGGVAISAKYYGHSICFLNTHLEAHLSRVEERVDDFHEVISEIDFDKTTTIMEHDVVFWAGDLNFRIDKIKRNEILQLIKKGDYATLLKEDQLIKHRRHNDTISEFVEDPIRFPPTYKFDPGTNTYDTSEKQRKPAWTDRILYHVNAEKTFIHDLVEMQLTCQVAPKSFANNLVQQEEGSYVSHMEFKLSDHKPVTAQYLLKLEENQTPLVELELRKVWESGHDNDVVISYHNGMTPGGKDYLALYEEKFTDFRDYKTYVYVPETNECEVTKGFSKICKFSSDKMEKESRFRIGYYSDRMSCLLALTEPFNVVC